MGDLCITLGESLEQPHQQQQQRLPPLAPPTPPPAGPPQQQDGPPKQKPPRVHHRSCVTCRKRKVRCDKKHPCQNCTKARIECVIPPAGHGGDRQAVADPELLGRLGHLESVLKTLISCIGKDRVNSALQGDLSVFQDSNRLHEARGHLRDHLNAPQPPPQPPESGFPPLPTLPSHHGSPGVDDVFSVNGSSPGNDSTNGGEAPSWTPYGKAGGKLVKDDGRDTYISGSFWESLHAGVEEVRELMDESEYGAEYESISSVHSPPDVDFLFDSGSQAMDLHSLHPSQTQRLKAWQLFKENVCPVATVLHIPSIEPALLEGMRTMRDVSKPLEALMFVVYYGTATSISADECHDVFGEEQSVVLNRFRSGLHQAFGRARLLQTDDILVLGAFVMFVVLLRHHDPRLSWNLTGLAVRLLQSLGLHRDGSSLNLSKFDAEMRRRLWWSICLLDTPASEDRSCTPNILEMSSFDASLPRNLNDSDLDPNMTEYPPDSEAMTTISLTLARCRSTDIWRTMIDTRRLVGNTGKSFASMTMAEKELWLREQERDLRRRFVPEIPSSDHLHWVTTTLVRSIICNLTLFVYNPLRSDVSLAEDERDRILLTAIECIEHSYRLRTDLRARRWAWLLNGYHEWFALTIVLMELCRRPIGKYVDRAWRVVEQSVVLRWDSPGDHKGAHQWRSILIALDKARARRRQVLQRRQSTSSTLQHPQKKLGTAALVAQPLEHHSPPAHFHPANVLPSPGSTHLTNNRVSPEQLKTGQTPGSIGLQPQNDTPRPDLPHNDGPLTDEDFDSYMLDIGSFGQVLCDGRTDGQYWGEPGAEFGGMRMDAGFA